MRRLVAMATASVALAVAAASCGIGGDGELQTIDREDLFGLDETSTSTSAPSTTASPPTSGSPVEPTVGATSTTIATEQVELYFVDGDRLQPVTIDLAGQASPTRVIAALMAGRPTGDIGLGLRTLLPPGLVNFPVVESGAGYVTVDLATDPFNRIDPADQRTAIAQIVMTLVKRPGIGQVRFTLDGELLRVPRRDGLQSEPGEGVYYDDYSSLLGVGEETTSTTLLTIPLPPSNDPSATSTPTEG